MYREMAWRTGLILSQGGSVVADAVFERLGDRERIEKEAADRGMPLLGIWLEADPTVLWQRVKNARAGRRTRQSTFCRDNSEEYGRNRVAQARCFAKAGGYRRRHTSSDADRLTPCSAGPIALAVAYSLRSRVANVSPGDGIMRHGKPEFAAHRSIVSFSPSMTPSISPIPSALA